MLLAYTGVLLNYYKGLTLEQRFARQLKLNNNLKMRHKDPVNLDYVSFSMVKNINS